MAKSWPNIVIGAGVAGLFYTLFKSQQEKVLLIDNASSREELGKRILVSGNGRCNFFNENLLRDDTFKLPFFNEVKDIVYQDGVSLARKVIDFFDDNGFAYYKEDDLYYPYFNRAECFHSFILNKINWNNVELLTGSVETINRKRKEIIVRCSDGEVDLNYNNLVVATGGFSYDRKVDYRLLDSLGVSYKPFRPCLCPVKTIEKIYPFLVGKRIRGEISLIYKKRTIHTETGEVLFKDDGLSGIAIFNLSLFINKLLDEGGKDVKIVIDFSEYKGQKLPADIDASCYPAFLKKYFEKASNPDNTMMIYTFKELYPFKFSQVSYGGIDLENIETYDMSLKSDKRIKLIGEMLDHNFPCGGYNIGMCLIEGYKAAIYGKRE